MWRIIHRVYKIFYWFLGGGFRCIMVFQDVFLFWKFNFSRVLFSIFFNITLVIIEMSMTCDLSFFWHYVGGYRPWYWIPPYLLCRDQSAAAWRCDNLIHFPLKEMIKYQHYSKNVYIDWVCGFCITIMCPLCPKDKCIVIEFLVSMICW